MRMCPQHAGIAVVLVLVHLLFFGSFCFAQDQDIRNEFRLTLFPYFPLGKQGHTGFGYVGYVKNDDKGVQSIYLGSGASYRPVTWGEGWIGLIGLYNDTDVGENSYELRPFIGGKFYVPNNKKINLYNFTRYEYRHIKQTESNDKQNISRLRSRFGIELPLSSNKWQPGTWYAFADVEPVYRFDTDIIDFVRLRLGPAYILNPRLRIEFQYYAQFTQDPTERSFSYTDNIFRINVKIGLTKSVLPRIFNHEFDPD